MKRFINDESGVLTFEWILLITILVVGVISGLAVVRDALVIELADIAQAIGSVDQSYYYYGIWTHIKADADVVFNPTKCDQNGYHYTCGSFYEDGLTTVGIGTQNAHGTGTGSGASYTTNGSHDEDCGYRGTL